MFLLSSDEDDNKQDMLEGIAYSKNSDLVLYSDGLEEYKKNGSCCSELTKGRFVIKYCENKKIVIRTDELGNELLFYYKKEKFWCISNSFLGLIIFLNEKGIELTASKTELAKFFVKTSLFEQPYNNNLPIKEVKLLNTDSELNIIDGVLKISHRNIVPVNKDEKLFIRIDSFINSSRSIIECFTKNFEINLELSGGMDSRLVLGLALPYRDNVVISSDKNRVNDYIIAKSLSSLFNISFRTEAYVNKGSKNLTDKWILYKLANIGISRTVPVPNGASGTEFSKIVRLNGGGAETIRAFFNINSDAYFNLIKKTGFTKDIESKLTSDLDNTLSLFGYYTNPAQAMINIYSEYRHRCFSGRAWYYSLFSIVFAPMSTRVFQSIIESPDLEKIFGCSREEVQEKNMVALLLIYILNKDLALIRFDEPQKDFSLKDIIRVEKIARNYKMNRKVDNKSCCYGSVKQGSVIPNFIRKYNSTYFESGKNYDDLLYKDIDGVEKTITKLNILNDEYTALILANLKLKSLDKNDKLACLHLKTIVDFATKIEE